MGVFEGGGWWVDAAWVCLADDALRRLRYDESAGSFDDAEEGGGKIIVLSFHIIVVTRTGQ